MLKLHNTLTRRLELVRPVSSDSVKIYTCGPTVYRDVHLGNLRSYLMADWIHRILKFQKLNVIHVKNITDVGHMRQEMLERGEDKVIAAAITKGKTPTEIADFYTQRFIRDERKLNIIPSNYLPRATDHVSEMLDIVENLILKGYAYEVDGNVYFEVSKFQEYGKLSGNICESGLLEAIRIEADPLKRDSRDFTLWKKAEFGRSLKWSSRWGEGFPGWHIECSAMSLKYLGHEFDLHTGGVDNIFPHHEGEMAQSEAFVGKRVVSHWVHGQHLLADGVKMSKSSGNSFVIDDIENHGVDPLAFRYLCLTVGYRSRLNFTFSSLKAAQQSLIRLQNRVWNWSEDSKSSDCQELLVTEWMGKFLDRINDNLDLPGALRVTWDMARSNLHDSLKLKIILEYDAVLGLGLDKIADSYEVSEDILNLVTQRSKLRGNGNYAEADSIRDNLDEIGYLLQDNLINTKVKPKSIWEKRSKVNKIYSSPDEVDSFVDDRDVTDFTVALVACNYLDDVKRCLASVLRWSGNHNVEVLGLDNGSIDGTEQWLDDISAQDSRVRIIHTDHVLGEGAAKNILLKQSLGKTIVLLDSSVEIVGNIFETIDDVLSDENVGVVGPFGLTSDDLRHFHGGEGESGHMDAMQAYCFAFRRKRLKDVGFMRQSFRFYRNLDLDYSLHFKNKGYSVIAEPNLPVVRHEHRVWTNIDDAEREALSRKNFRRLLDKWGDRTDLLVSNIVK